MSEQVTSEQNRETALPRVRPASDIIQREDGFHIIMDMPGLGRDDVVLDLREDELVVSGVMKLAPAEGEKFVEVEFGGREYRRAFTLSDSVDRSKITANFNDGVLEIVLPKAAKAEPRRIEIQAG